MKCFLIVGEASDDLHAASLMEALREQCPAIQFYGLGGDKMRAAGAQLYQHYRKMAYMGVLAVLRHLPDVWRNFRIARRALLEVQPEVLVLVDYPSFNLRMAAFCKRHLPHTRVVYYIPPKVWAWKTYRVHRIARVCDEVLAIFPFEPAFYQRYGYRCTYVGNPTVQELSAMSLDVTSPKQGVSILPGSRRSEVKHCLPVMLAAARRVCETMPLTVCAAPSIEDAFYLPYLQPGETLTRDTYYTLAHARAAIVNSGTATLEAAWIGCAQVAVYRVAMSKWLGWLQPVLFKIPFFTLVNIIANKPVIEEAIGARFTQRHIEEVLKRLLTDSAYVQQMQADYAAIRTALGTSDAAATAAQHILAIV